MTGDAARAQILARIRAGLASVASHPVATAVRSPETADHGVVIARFRQHAHEAAATTERIPAFTDIPASVARYLRGLELPTQALIADDIRALGGFRERPDELTVIDRPLRPDGDAVVTGCYAGVADAGAVVTVSAAGYPVAMNFLAETHVAVVPANRIFADHDALWACFDDEFGDARPRMMNWIVGPSRTADLGVPSKLGAHGPARVHLLIVDE